MSQQVLDKNDNAPTFSSDVYAVSVSEAVEPHTQLVQVLATDPDLGSHGEVSYAFGERSKRLARLFSVDPNTGWISTQDTLDFERRRQYDLEVVAADNGGNGLTSTAKVKVTVVDANDNPTAFSQRHYTAAVNEGALPGTIIFALLTEDADEVALTDPEFFIVSGDPLGQFQVKKNGELYVNRHLDRESVSSYRLEVKVTDGVFVSECKVTVEILDDNDSPPLCERTLYSAVVAENTDSGTFITAVGASDADEGANARQIYYLSGDGAELFSVERDTGEVRTAMPLDREDASSHVISAHVQV